MKVLKFLIHKSDQLELSLADWEGVWRIRSRVFCSALLLIL